MSDKGKDAVPPEEKPDQGAEPKPEESASEMPATEESDQPAASSTPNKHRRGDRGSDRRPRDSARDSNMDEYWVRFSHMRYRERFRTSVRNLSIGDSIVLKTPRGVETGIVISDTGKRKGDPDSIGEILRTITQDDQKRVADLPGLVKGREFQFCKIQIEKLKLPMKLIGVEHLFGGGKLIFYFVADGRDDFRELVRLLAAEFRTRIEMKQVGVRDEARLTGSCNNCGRELCCRSFIREFKPITMKMAKNQKTTLDPSQLSGQCGRLKCCLRYEDEVYTELRKDLPRKKNRVMTPDGPARVLNVEVILQKVLVELEQGSRVAAYPSSEIEKIRTS